jgi:acetyl-CoA carboxylase biotin carboxylase subunit
MTLIANKLLAKNTMKSLNVSVIPGSDDEINNVPDVIAIAKKIGFPILLKSVFGGGGKGIVFIEDEEMRKETWGEKKKKP